MQTVVIVLASIGGCIFLLGLLTLMGWAFYDYRRRNLILIRSLDDLRGNIQRFESNLDKISNDQTAQVHELVVAVDRYVGLEAIPGYIEGLSKVCADQVLGIQELVKAVARFHATMFGPGEPNKERADRGGFIAYSDERADEAWQIEQMVESGYNREEATERVRGAKSAPKFTIGA